MQVESALPSWGLPHVILRSLQKLHGGTVFFCSVVVDRDGTFDGFDEDEGAAEAAGGFKLADWGWGAIRLT